MGQHVRKAAKGKSNHRGKVIFSLMAHLGGSAYPGFPSFTQYFRETSISFVSKETLWAQPSALETFADIQMVRSTVYFWLLSWLELSSTLPSYDFYAVTKSINHSLASRPHYHYLNSGPLYLLSRDNLKPLGVLNIEKNFGFSTLTYL